MTYRVEITGPASDDINTTLAWLERELPDSAQPWYERVVNDIRSLKELPQRCPVAPESYDSGAELRHLLSGKGRHVYRIIFCIEDECVYVLHVMHGARKHLD